MKRLFAVSYFILLLALFTSSAFAGTCTGNCGTLGANGTVSAPPGGGTYSYVSTNGGVAGAGQLNEPGGSVPGTTYTNGSSFVTDVFSANIGAKLDYNFNYITSDGGIYTDYGFAAIFKSDGTFVDLLYSATTNVTPVLTDPGAIYFVNVGTGIGSANNTGWDPLGGWSGGCYNVGCGQTGWQSASYTIQASGSYYLEFGVTNALDTQWDSGLAWSGTFIDGKPIPGVPEPCSLLLLGSGLVGLWLRRRR